MSGDAGALPQSRHCGRKHTHSCTPELKHQRVPTWTAGLQSGEGGYGGECSKVAAGTHGAITTRETLFCVLRNFACSSAQPGKSVLLISPFCKLGHEGTQRARGTVTRSRSRRVTEPRAESRLALESKLLTSRVYHPQSR